MRVSLVPKRYGSWQKKGHSVRPPRPIYSNSSSPHVLASRRVQSRKSGSCTYPAAPITSQLLRFE